jgi:hypothetical protein
VRGTSVAVSLVSPSATLGADSDYPILTVTGRIPADTPIGAVFPVTLDPNSLQLFDAAGIAYRTETEDGHLMSARGIAVHDVIPGSAALPAGSVVSIYGLNFQHTTKVRFEETELDLVRYISPNQIDVVLAQPAVMHGMGIRAENRDGSRTEYFSYQRTRRFGTSAHQILRDAVPLFSQRMTQTATVRFSSGGVAALALQNLEPAAAEVVAVLRRNDGSLVANTVVSVPSNHYVLGELSEMFQAAAPDSSIVQITAVTPVQVLGVKVEGPPGAERVTARLPE